MDICPAETAGATN